MNLARREQEIFEEWAPVRPGFVTDGVVDEDIYTKSQPKILLILKEVNDRNGGGWDLRQLLRESTRRQTWDNVARWVHGIRQLERDIPWEELRELPHPIKQAHLRSIAVMNLKKSPGGHTTDHQALKRVAKEDKDFINRQFALYEPDLVICCGTAWEFYDKVHLSPVRSGNTERGVGYQEYQPGKFVLEFAHPEARVKDSLLYYGLLDAVRELLAHRR